MRLRLASLATAWSRSECRARRGYDPRVRVPMPRNCLQGGARGAADDAVFRVSPASTNGLATPASSFVASTPMACAAVSKSTNSGVAVGALAVSPAAVCPVDDGASTDASLDILSPPCVTFPADAVVTSSAPLSIACAPASTACSVTAPCHSSSTIASSAPSTTSISRTSVPQLTSNSSFIASATMTTAIPMSTTTTTVTSTPVSIPLSTTTPMSNTTIPMSTTTTVTSTPVSDPLSTTTTTVTSTPVSIPLSTTTPMSNTIPMSTTTTTVTSTPVSDPLSTTTTTVTSTPVSIPLSTTTPISTTTPMSTTTIATFTPPSTTTTTTAPPSTRSLPAPSPRSFTATHFSETELVLQGSLRKVRPYYADAVAHCKARWLGLSLRQIYEREFHSETVASYEAACAVGRLTLNGLRTHLDAVLRDGDTIRLRAHRHEPPVSSRPVVVVAEEHDLVAVDKPASLPVHPCGRYRHGSLLFVLGKEHGVSGLHTLHRLDRLASGLVVFAKSREASRRVDEQIRQRLVHKEYLCRVVGEFPAGEVVCEEPLSVVEGRLGVSRVDRLAGKPSRSLFRRLRYDADACAGGSSLLSCVPVTGRSHQLRVHLQSLGFPILLDPLYGSPAWASGAPLVDVLRRIADETCEPSARSLVERLGAADDWAWGRIPPGTGGVRGGGDVASEPVMAEVVWPERDPICSECRLQRPDPRPRDLGMCLHALRYSGPGWGFEVPMPDWAAPDWTEDLAAF
ncbi:pseudouridylate synthase RPUSD2-like [Lethenteron reissneri]|uniref:pseudouridylate synthase RPUSD2-like n=1 Tax=Lethenteron reissneri TaxID=7753 RepID=UPI002AB7DE18|nr:pseudouridylate synthase RPUSD2-like [Lethenteron reissneri]